MPDLCVEDVLQFLQTHNLPNALAALQKELECPEGLDAGAAAEKDDPFGGTDTTMSEGPCDSGEHLLKNGDTGAILQELCEAAVVEEAVSTGGDAAASASSAAQPGQQGKKSTGEMHYTLEETNPDCFKDVSGHPEPESIIFFQGDDDGEGVGEELSHFNLKVPLLPFFHYSTTPPHHTPAIITHF